MKKETVTLEEKKLMGLKVRTSYKNETDPSTSKIGPCIARYSQEQISRKIPHVKYPHITVCAYTDYESDYKGEYTCFIGQEVTTLDTIPEGLETLTIPPQTYVKFTTEPGAIPPLVVKAWQHIWQMSSTDLGGPRTYRADFEIYDERAHDPQHAVIDLYVGVRKSA